MKKLLLLLIIPFLSFGQLTMIPDSNFEQRLINFGYDDVLDGTVLTAAIDTVTQLEVSYYGISDLTGIEDFTDLAALVCANNDLTSLDVSQNMNLMILNVADNQLTTIDVSQNTLLTYLNCSMNSNLSELDVSNNPFLTNLFCEEINLLELNVTQNIQLEILWCGFNQLTVLDVSNNTNLTWLCCQMNSLSELDISNNLNLNSLCCFGNYNSNTDIGLGCVQVWDIDYAEKTFSISNANIVWSLDCVNEIFILEPGNKNESLLQTIDILSKETTGKGFQLHIYDNGSVEKKYLIK